MPAVHHQQQQQNTHQSSRLEASGSSSSSSSSQTPSSALNSGQKRVEERRRVSDTKSEVSSAQHFQNMAPNQSSSVALKSTNTIVTRRKPNTWPTTKYDISNLPEELRIFMKRHMPLIMNHELAWPFLEPVDDVALQIPDYYLIIKNPMDLGTLKKRYSHGWYTSVTHFLSDFKMIFSNCYRFNNPATDVHGMARDLEIFSQKYIEPLERIAAQESVNIPNNESKHESLIFKTNKSKEIKTASMQRQRSHSFQVDMPFNSKKKSNTSNVTSSKSNKQQEKVNLSYSPSRKTKTNEKTDNNAENVDNNLTSQNNHQTKKDLKKKPSIIIENETIIDKRSSQFDISSSHSPKLMKKQSKRAMVDSNPISSPQNLHEHSKNNDSIVGSLSPSKIKLVTDNNNNDDDDDLSNNKTNKINDSTIQPILTNDIQESCQKIDLPKFLKESSLDSRQHLFDPYLHYNNRSTDAMQLKVHEDCQQILILLKHEQLSSIMWPFIKHPPNTKYPDLQFVECSLNLGHYKTVEEFVTAIRHIFMNVITQFDSSSYFVKLAHLCLEAFHDIYSNYFSNRQSILNISQLVTLPYILVNDHNKNLKDNNMPLLQSDKSNTNNDSNINNYPNSTSSPEYHKFNSDLKKNIVTYNKPNKVDELYELLMRDCEAQKNIQTSDQKLRQLEKRLEELEKQFAAHKFHTTLTIDKLRKRISYLKSKQQSDLIFINESFQVAVKKVASHASPIINGQLIPVVGASTMSSSIAPGTSVVSGNSSSLDSNKFFKEKVKNYSRSKGTVAIREMDQMEQTSRSILLAGASKSDDEEESLRILTSEEKRKLSHDINRLSQKMLTELVEIIARHEGINPENEKELTLDYDKMKPATLRTVLRFVQGCVKRLPRLKQIQNIPVTNFFDETSSPSLQQQQQQQQQNSTNDDNLSQNLSPDQNQSQQSVEQSRIANFPYFQTGSYQNLSKSAQSINNSLTSLNDNKTNQNNPKIINKTITSSLNNNNNTTTTTSSTITNNTYNNNNNGSSILSINSNLKDESMSMMDETQQANLANSSPVSNINKKFLNNHLINLMKTSANTQLNAAVQSLKEKTSSLMTTTTSLGKHNHIQINDNNTIISENNDSSNNQKNNNYYYHQNDEKSNSQIDSIQNKNNVFVNLTKYSGNNSQNPNIDSSTSAWSMSFSDDKQFTSNSEALNEAKKIESVKKGLVNLTDSNSTSIKQSSINIKSIDDDNNKNKDNVYDNDNNAIEEHLVSNNANITNKLNLDVSNHSNVTNQQVLTNESNNINNSNSVKLNNNLPKAHNQLQNSSSSSKEQLKAEAQKRRAANADNKNEAILQRELIDSFEQQSSSNFI